MNDRPATLATEWTFDVALSFSGEDREKARLIAEALRDRGLTVFYDEWFKSHLLGENLITYLREVYLKAHFCVPIISKNYVSGAYPRHELNVMLERALLDNVNYILPVRLDNSEVPGMSKLVVTVNYDSEGPAGIATLIQQKLAFKKTGQTNRQLSANQFVCPEKPKAGLAFYQRHPAKHALRISERSLLTLALDYKQYASAEMRARLARELCRYLNFKHNMELGAPYGAWRDGDLLILSTLPDLQSPQRTLEFKILDSTSELVLVSEWKTQDLRYDAIDFRDWQPAVKGLTADRSVPDLNREVVILIMEKKGATFGFPITSGTSDPEKLCGWVQEEPPSDYLDWGRDPRLIPDGMALWESLFHRPTGVGIWKFILQGRWSSSAFLALAESMAALLPYRHHFEILGQGSFRVSVCLSVNQNFKNSSNGEYDNDHVQKTVQRTYSALARMIAAHRQQPVPPPGEEASVPPLSQFHYGLFQEAVNRLGNAEYVKPADQSDPDFYEAEWIKLRHSYWAGRIGLEYDPRRFMYHDVVTFDELRNYILDNER